MPYTLITWYSFPVASYSMSLWKDYNPSAKSKMTSTHLLKEKKRSCTSFQPFGYTSQSPPSAFYHCRFLEHELWIILSSLLSVFVFIIHTVKMKSESLRLWPKRKGTFMKLHFVTDFRRFPVFTTTDRERTLLGGNLQDNGFFYMDTSAGKVLWETYHKETTVKQWMATVYSLTELCCLRYSAAFSSALPPISPIRMMPSVFGSCRNTSRQSMKLVPLNGSPPIPYRRKMNPVNIWGSHGSEWNKKQLYTLDVYLTPQYQLSGTFGCSLERPKTNPHCPNHLRKFYLIKIQWHFREFPSWSLFLYW